MAYTVTGIERETDDQGFLREPDYSDEVVRVIAAAENIALTDGALGSRQLPARRVPRARSHAELS